MSALVGIFFHAIGGFCAGSFYLPLKKVQRWSWESYWLVNGIVAWLIMPILVALIIIPNLMQVYIDVDFSSIAWAFFFGILWGIGGITFGLTMRFLGMALGMALALGLTAIIGTLVPPAYSGELMIMINTSAGIITLSGVLVIGIGIVVCGMAGLAKDKESVGENSAIAEFDLLKGFGVALIAGVMSACMAFGLAAGKPIAEMSLHHGVEPIWQNTAVFVIIFAGGLTTNLIWCFYLNLKNNSFSDYKNPAGLNKTNYLLCAAAGIIWYSQFMFYGIGATYMGDFEFAGWSLHMAFIILFSTMWGLLTKEWLGASRKTLVKNYIGLSLLLLAISVIGYGAFLQSAAI